MIALALGLVAFVVFVMVGRPANWNSDDWYRTDALVELQDKPLAYGGNESCVACHEGESDDIETFKHQTLSCESCHGSLADHVKGNDKIADAYVEDDDQWQCLNCHKELISKSQDFPQFSKERTREHIMVEADMPCILCHDAHDPTM